MSDLKEITVITAKGTSTHEVIVVDGDVIKFKGFVAVDVGDKITLNGVDRVISMCECCSDSGFKVTLK